MIRSVTWGRFLKDLVGIVDNHIAHAPRACDEDSRIEPCIPLIASLKGEMQAHSECIRANLALAQLLQNFFLSRSCSVIRNVSMASLNRYFWE